MSEIINKNAVFIFWGLFISVIIALLIWVDYQKDISGVTTANGKVRIGEQVKKQINDQIKPIGQGKEVRSSNFICPANIPTKDFFAPDEILYFPLQVVNIMPDSSYVMDYSIDTLLHNLNDAYMQAKIQFVLSEGFINDVYPKITKKALRQQDLLNLYNRYDILTLLILPKKTVLDIELSADKSKKVRHVWGRANGVGSTTCFMREEAATGNITMHEFGHMFGLLHLHEGNFEVTKHGYSCDVGDNVYDTPATSTGVYVVSPEGQCRYESDDPEATEYEKMVIYSNFLAYSAPACMNVDAPGFTKGQVSAMRAFVDKSMVHREMLINNDFMLSFDISEKLFVE